ncbi:hypothetical protein [Capillimicrobium parvum]|uniref:Uncharacterized protein n=1 Tax=Capillimicrobium parvum TaxID=2884022 RepID=A0A9E6XZW8_9ACTN|nr:hypothetical protein [Capillimicrobium parvum]UGS37539.1 hypothetical protein DSM104329_03956 [Capillimicrobium parvum]
MAGDDPRDIPNEREIEAAEHERRRLEDTPEPEPKLDHVRRALRRHDEQLRED